MPAAEIPSAAPPGLVVGVGARHGVDMEEVAGLIGRTLAAAGLSAGGVVELATVEAKAAEPGLVAAAARFGVPLRGYGAAVLARVAVPCPSGGAALAAVGTPSVAEAAALLAAGPGGELLVGKRKSAPPGRPARATCAVARRPAPAKGGQVGQG
ncbi:cobalamin biosynthesis protein [Streptomyces cuspidosporus]